MVLQKIPFRSSHAFTEFFLKYIEQDPSLQPFYSAFPEIENFKNIISEKSKSFPESHRKILVKSLELQYKNISSPQAPVSIGIQSLLLKNTFTITTGHQLNIFTGPLYFIYKIVTVINACKKLKSRYPDYNFVPMYWMASEDHDYEEIKSIRLYENKYTWETNQQGAVGRFHTKDFENLLAQLPGDVTIFREAYLKSNSLGDAVRVYVNALFGSEGLVVVDADDRELKKLLEPVITDDLLLGTPNQLVNATNKALEGLGLHPQVHSREVNFFYLDKNLRSRLERDGKGYQVVDTEMKFTRKELENLIQSEPEKFSPNVILRPVYQEIILPNLAYVGGPAELVYWLQLKSVFTHFKVPYPVLLPRNFALIIDVPVRRKLAKTGLEVSHFFEEKNYLFNHWVSKYSMHDLSLGKTLKLLEQQLIEIRERCAAIDQSLTPMVQAEGNRMRHSLEKIERKMLRAEKRLQSDKLRQIEAVKDALFPNGGLQERTDNFLNFYQNDPVFIQKLVDTLDPFDFQMNVLSYHD